MLGLDVISSVFWHLVGWDPDGCARPKSRPELKKERCFIFILIWKKLKSKIIQGIKVVSLFISYQRRKIFQPLSVSELCYMWDDVIELKGGSNKHSGSSGVDRRKFRTSLLLCICVCVEVFFLSVINNRACDFALSPQWIGRRLWFVFIHFGWVFFFKSQTWSSHKLSGSIQR